MTIFFLLDLFKILNIIYLLHGKLQSLRIKRFEIGDIQFTQRDFGRKIFFINIEILNIFGPSQGEKHPLIFKYN